MREVVRVSKIDEDTKEIVWTVDSITSTRARTAARLWTVASLGPDWSVDDVSVQQEKVEGGLRYRVTVVATRDRFDNVSDRFTSAVNDAADKWREGMIEGFD